jgi:pSer/pThr/pTyr-binding forkhead associated (FHA) protein
LDYDVPGLSPYVVLETYSNADEKTRIIHVLNFAGTSSLTVGRCSESNLKIPDNTVSRLHSEIITDGTKFYQMDLQSKFGTLRVFRKPLRVTNSLIIQAG